MGLTQDHARERDTHTSERDTHRHDGNDFRGQASSNSVGTSFFGSGHAPLSLYAGTLATVTRVGGDWSATISGRGTTEGPLALEMRLPLHAHCHGISAARSACTTTATRHARLSAVARRLRIARTCAKRHDELRHTSVAREPPRLPAYQDASGGTGDHLRPRLERSTIVRHVTDGIG